MDDVHLWPWCVNYENVLVCVVLVQEIKNIFSSSRLTVMTMSDFHKRSSISTVPNASHDQHVVAHVHLASSEKESTGKRVKFSVMLVRSLKWLSSNLCMGT